jgi:GNAT superfamily N-acetyltransferase
VDGVQLRRARQGDARAAADVWLRSRHSPATQAPPPAHTDDEVRDYFATVVLPEREVWVAEKEDGSLVAVMVLEDGWLGQLYVDEPYTGRGIGADLVALAKRRRPDGLQLWTFESNTGAQRFYERHGFVAVERTDGHANEEGAPDIRYVWPPPGGTA